ncbi:hypothetical protein AGMMS49953_08880 [Endomicrobiia bacterium]|nr:hypothetical protein AGMMS49953_08880 [Endomicrobiia bacterium]
MFCISKDDMQETSQVVVLMLLSFSGCDKLLMTFKSVVTKRKVSAYILTKNEERHIKECVESIK